MYFNIEEWEWQKIISDLYEITRESDLGQYKESYDVIENIASDMEDEFCRLVSGSLKRDGVAIIGTPSITMNPYACEASKIGHINL